MFFNLDDTWTPSAATSYLIKFWVYRYRVGIGKAAECLFTIMSKTEEMALDEARVYYPRKDDEFIFAEKQPREEKDRQVPDAFNFSINQRSSTR